MAGIEFIDDAVGDGEELARACRGVLHHEPYRDVPRRIAMIGDSRRNQKPIVLMLDNEVSGREVGGVSHLTIQHLDLLIRQRTVVNPDLIEKTVEKFVNTPTA